MKKILPFILLSLIGCKSSQDPTPSPTPTGNNPIQLLFFRLNETSGQTTAESVTGSSFSINGPTGSAERIAGLEGNALRVNGYYGWASGNTTVNYPTSNIGISGWIAPAAFPVQRKDEDPITENTVAAIFCNQNTSNSSGVSFGINQHGKIIAQFKIGNSIQQIISNEEVQLKKWSLIALNIDAAAGNAKLYLNGLEIETISFNAGTITWDNSATVYIGKEAKSKTFAGYDTNALTGAIDAVSVWNKLLTPTQIMAQYAAVTPAIPDLKIPTARFANDYLRPKYHLLPTAGWTNESHGMIYLDGKYHIFSQRNFNGPYLQHINWGHYESTDLLNWQETKQALWPQPGFDEVGIWSGHAIVKNNTPYLFYTGVNKAKAAIGLATSTSPYLDWTKNSSAIISGAPTTLLNADFRDPFVFQNGTDYFMMVGTGLRNGTSRGGLFLYKSTSSDFTQWNYQGTMLEGIPSTDNSGDFWEVPVYYNFGTKSIVLVNKLPNANSLYWTGTFNGSQFVKDNPIPERLDVINTLLAPTIQQDANGNLTAIGIIPDGVTATKSKELGWANVFSLPRVWTLVNNKIVQVPHPNLLNLRGASQNFTNVSFNQTTTNALNGASGTQYEIVATINPGTATQVGFILNKGATNGEKTIIYYDYSSSSFVVNRSSSSLLSGVPLNNQSTSYAIPAGNVTWRIFVDASVVEVFVNDNLAFATRSFPSQGSNLIDLYSQGGTATATDLKIYNIQGGGTTSVARLIEDKKKIDFKVFPNPSENNFSIEFSEINSGTVIYAYVVDITGTPVKKIEAFLNPENKTIYWDGLLENGQKAKQGIYILKGIINNELFDTKLIVK